VFRSRDALAAEKEASVTCCRDLPGCVRLRAREGEEVGDLVTARVEELGDQAPVTAGPERLGAEERGRRLLQRRREGALPFGCRHPRRVAPEGGDPDTAEALLAGLVRTAPAELGRVPVVDPCGGERPYERLLAELRVAARPGEAPDVDDGAHAGGGEHREELLDRAGPVTDRSHEHARQRTVMVEIASGPAERCV